LLVMMMDRSSRNTGGDTALESLSSAK